MNKRILITGGSGLIGNRLTHHLLLNGFEVAWLGRSEKSIDGVKSYTWDINNQTIDINAFQEVFAIVHLAGEGIANKRWAPKQKENILKSRINSTNLLYNTVAREKIKLDVFISASGSGYYGYNNDEKELHEESLSGNDFIAEVVKYWEKTADQFVNLGIRTVKLRTGIVLSDKGGALKKIASPIRWGVGSPLGSGKQYISWIHIDDLCKVIIHAIENKKVNGAFNAASPQPVTNADFTKAIAKTLNRPIILPSVPAWVLKNFLGEMSNLVLGSSKLSCLKITKTGFNFKYISINLALDNLLKSK
ncbi:MAG: TIGR01777 family oxidoreductase [Cyclobacteriaceae bacterium]|nr:TIGR01777 family oxidoreductase [Cyclobacteriaceae bacterium]